MDQIVSSQNSYAENLTHVSILEIASVVNWFKVKWCLKGRALILEEFSSEEEVSSDLSSMGEYRR